MPVKTPVAAAPQEPITVAEAAQILSVHVVTLRNWIYAGKIPYYRLGARNVRLDRADVLALLKRNGQVSGAGAH